LEDSRTVEGPVPECALCPRLAAFRAENRARCPDWHNRPVPSFGELDAWLLIVGLAPGLRGANRTGRPFAGDHAGGLLYPTLIRLGLARGTYDAEASDAFALVGCRITNAVRCVPPGNRPTPDEVRACGGFLRAEIAAMPRLRVIVALGAIAHAATLAALALRPRDFAFGHGRAHVCAPRLNLPGLTVIDSYHCSRLNTNTGRLTATMFEAVFRTALDRGRAESRSGQASPMG
jgi:uracil-DNA glycosylase family 4